MGILNWCFLTKRERISAAFLTGQRNRWHMLVDKCAATTIVMMVLLSTFATAYSNVFLKRYPSSLLYSSSAGRIMPNRRLLLPLGFASTVLRGNENGAGMATSSTQRRKTVPCTAWHSLVLPRTLSISTPTMSLFTASSSTGPFKAKSSMPITFLKSLYSTTTRRYSKAPLDSNSREDTDMLTLSGYKRPTINWYPGHIAKAERLLSETLRSVDVVIEVRDARAPKATAHPRVGEWIAGKPRIVVLTKVDLIPSTSRALWKMAYGALGAAYTDNVVNDGQIRNQAKQTIADRVRYENDGAYSRSREGSTKEQSLDLGQHSKLNHRDHDKRKADKVTFSVENVLFLDAKRGSGIHALHRAIIKAGSHVNERRNRRGLSDRALRVGVIGFPNVGKSALINRILGRKRARSANTPGVTRSLQWIRVTKGNGPSIDGGGGTRGDKGGKKNVDFELLDSPGIIPANMIDQSDAILLAACNSIGEGAYDNQGVASYLMEWIKTLHIMGNERISAPQWRAKCKERYHFDPMAPIIDNRLFPPAGSVYDDSSSNNQKHRLATGDDILFLVADNTCRGDPEDAARKILQDFRTGRLGPISLQLAPQQGVDSVVQNKKFAVFDDHDYSDHSTVKSKGLEQPQSDDDPQGREETVILAMDKVMEKGLKLPYNIQLRQGEELSSTASLPFSKNEVGKGQFDGW